MGYQDRRTELAKLLEQSVEHLSEDLLNEAKPLEEAINTGKVADISQAAQNFLKLPQLECIKALTEIEGKIDPHAIEPKQFRELWRKKPEQLIEEGLAEGKYRERRIILDARNLQTNQRLGWVAIIAAVVALSVPFIDHLLSLWLK
jgi:hypothetical protein